MYRGRRAVSIENDHLRVTVLAEGGHIADVLDKRTGINPLWTPPWQSIEPSTFDLSQHASYGGAAEGRLLASIMGHNLCLDIFGGPSPEEAAAGLGAHGEASVVAYEFRASAKQSKVFEGTFGRADYLAPGATFEWPFAPTASGGAVDLQRYSDASMSSAYTAHLMDASRADAFFVAFDPEPQLAFGYVWRRADFPWMGIWEENCSRAGSPWNNRVVTRGMEFGVSPFPESRREMIERGRLFDTPTFRWIPAGTAVTTDYRIVMLHTSRVPEAIS